MYTLYPINMHTDMSYFDLFWGIYSYSYSYGFPNANEDISQDIGIIDGQLTTTITQRRVECSEY